MNVHNIQGRAAFESGVHFAANPYHHSTRGQAHRDWAAGWNEEFYAGFNRMLAERQRERADNRALAARRQAHQSWVHANLPVDQQRVVGVSPGISAPYGKQPGTVYLYMDEMGGDDA